MHATLWSVPVSTSTRCTCDIPCCLAAAWLCTCELELGRGGNTRPATPAATVDTCGYTTPQRAPLLLRYPPGDCRCLPPSLCLSPLAPSHPTPPPSTALSPEHGHAHRAQALPRCTGGHGQQEAHRGGAAGEVGGEVVGQREDLRQAGHQGQQVAVQEQGGVQREGDAAQVA